MVLHDNRCYNSIMFIRIPKYTRSEELVNAISHGAGAVFAIVALVLMEVRAHGALQRATVAIFGGTMILLYTISCIYHALSPRVAGKKVLRVIDHCNVYLLVLGTYIPVALLAIQGALGWILFGIVTTVTIVGIVLSAVAIDKFQVFEVVCHLVNGWSVLLGVRQIAEHAGTASVALILVGGAMYSLGALLYCLGKRKRYMHSVFHFFCLAGTVLQWVAVFGCIL